MTETDRVVALSSGPPLDAEVPLGPGLALRGDAPLLRPAQEEALSALARAVRSGIGPWGPRGVAGLIGCGHGKTLVAQLAPLVAGSRRPLLLLPAALSRQLDADVKEWSPYYPLVDPPRLSYERLSGPQSQRVLDDLQPDFLLLDEAHKLANPSSARWRRVSRYLQANPRTRVMILSGTLSWKNLSQMRHLLVAALRDWAPVPADGTIAHWGAVLDVGGEPSSDCWRVFAPVLEWAGEDRRTKEGARRAFRARLSTAPGVVLTPGVAADVSLRLSRWVPRAVPTWACRDAQVVLDSTWRLPDGTELVDTLEYARHERTLALGFFLRWDPSTVDPGWVDARRFWGRAVRKGVAYLGFDSPALVARAAEAGDLPSGMLAAWRAWVPYRRRTPPETEAVWVDLDWPVRVAREYLEIAGRDALIWVQSRVLGARLQDAGIPYHGAGSHPPERGPAAVSIGVYGTGWNGQHYSRQLLLEPPSSGGVWEQLLARTHRAGQVHDVAAAVLCASPCQRVALEVGLASARYVQDSQGLPQRLLLADWE